MPDHTSAASNFAEDQPEPQPPRPEPAKPVLPRRLVFRPPAVSLVVLVVAAVCASPVALALPWFWLLYLIPLGGVVWVLRTRTVVDADKLVVRRTFHRTRIPWHLVASLRMRDKKWLTAVLSDGSEIALPEVRTRHLPVLALITGGRIADPTEPRPETPPEAETETETEAQTEAQAQAGGEAAPETAEAPAVAGETAGASTIQQSTTEDRASDQGPV